MSTRRIMASCSALGLALLMIVSCSMFDKGPVKPETAPKRLPDVREFDDVLIPREMSAGLLRLSGRVEANSLMRYFQNNMTNEGWRLVTHFRSPHSLMLFQKGNRMAIIAIEDADFQTFADVWVVPLNESIDSTPPK
jgi:hypothetical protein